MRRICRAGARRVRPAAAYSSGAARSGLSENTLQALWNGQRDIDADTDRCLAQCLAHSAGVWLDGQAFYEAGATASPLAVAQRDNASARDATA